MIYNSKANNKSTSNKNKNGGKILYVIGKNTYGTPMVYTAFPDIERLFSDVMLQQ